MSQSVIIFAHNDLEQLKYLLKSLDYEFFDIYVHIDKKIKHFNLDNICKKSKLFIYPDRRKLKWGGYNFIKTNLDLLSYASSKNYYNYYHILSGQDMCIKNPSEVFNYFENKDEEFCTFCGKDWQQKSLDRVMYYRIQCGRNKFLKYIDTIFLKLQKIIKIDRLKKINIKIVGGSNWVSLTSEATKYILSKRDNIAKIFKHSFCADELFIHTILYNSEFKNKIHLLKIKEKNDNLDHDMYEANKRYIDWVRGTPYTFNKADLNSLIEANYFFARKFSTINGNELQEKLLEINQK